LELVHQIEEVLQEKDALKQANQAHCNNTLLLLERITLLSKDNARLQEELQAEKVKDSRNVVIEQELEISNTATHFYNSLMDEVVSRASTTTTTRDASSGAATSSEDDTTATTTTTATPSPTISTKPKKQPPPPPTAGNANDHVSVSVSTITATATTLQLQDRLMDRAIDTAIMNTSILKLDDVHDEKKASSEDHHGCYLGRTWHGGMIMQSNNSGIGNQTNNSNKSNNNLRASLHGVLRGSSSNNTPTKTNNISSSSSKLTKTSKTKSDSLKSSLRGIILGGNKSANKSAAGNNKSTSRGAGDSMRSSLHGRLRGRQQHTHTKKQQGGGLVESSIDSFASARTRSTYVATAGDGASDEERQDQYFAGTSTSRQWEDAGYTNKKGRSNTTTSMSIQSKGSLLLKQALEQHEKQKKVMVPTKTTRTRGTPSSRRNREMAEILSRHQAKAKPDDVEEKDHATRKLNTTKEGGRRVSWDAKLIVDAQDEQQQDHNDTINPDSEKEGDAVSSSNHGCRYDVSARSAMGPRTRRRNRLASSPSVGSISVGGIAIGGGPTGI
jgi:hypothetical protein